MTLERDVFRKMTSYSVFALLLLNTLVSTIVVALVSVSSLQRVADEHPRRYLSKTLFSYVVNSFQPEELSRVRLDGARFEVFPLDRLPTDIDLPFETLLDGIHRDPDGVAITVFHDRYMAAAIHGNTLVVLPQFGRSLSTQAMALVGLVVATVLTVLLVNVVAIRYLTSPFSVFKRVVKNVDDGNLSFRVPLEKTYGEFRDLANSFNGMLQRLEHVNAARRHMLLAIPHEVRTPLARLKVRKDLIADHDLRREISRDINNLEEILDTILQTERLQSHEGKIKREEIDVEAFFCEIVDEFREYYDKLTLVLDTADDTFHADGFSVGLLLKNLISNAIRYGRGRSITVTVTQPTSSPDALVLSVADEGVGIPDSQIPYMTEPFWRLDESRQRKSGGYGLGLYLCDTITKSHDGKLTIRSKVDQGTTVTVALPTAFATQR